MPAIKCHPQLLSQVFMNLLVNAAHAIETQGEITVRTWQENGSVCVAVEDTGSGIPEEIRKLGLRAFLHYEGDGERYRARALHQL